MFPLKKMLGNIFKVFQVFALSDFIKQVFTNYTSYYHYHQQLSSYRFSSRADVEGNNKLHLVCFSKHNPAQKTRFTYRGIFQLLYKSSPPPAFQKSHQKVLPPTSNSKL